MEAFIELIAPFLGLDPGTLGVAVSILSLVLTIALTIFGPLLTWYWYVTGHIPDHITYSKNTIEETAQGPILRVRTLMHSPRDDIVPNNLWLNTKVWLAKRRCNEEESFIRLCVHDSRLFLPQITSAFSATFAEGFLAEDVPGFEVKKVRYRISTHYECYPNGHASKMHCFVVPEDELRRYIDSAFCESISTELPKHSRRIWTLHRMAIMYAYEENCNVPEDDRLVRFVEGAMRV